MDARIIALGALADLRRERDRLADEMRRRQEWNRCGRWWSDRVELLARIDAGILEAIKAIA